MNFEILQKLVCRAQGAKPAQDSRSQGQGAVIQRQEGRSAREAGRVHENSLQAFQFEEEQNTWQLLTQF